MALTNGSQLGPYEIQSAIDVGGAEEVYRARDTRLDRTVTIKILPHWNEHPELRDRFEAEAKLIAGLQHPHIRLLHDIGRERPRPAGDAEPAAVNAEAEASVTAEARASALQSADAAVATVDDEAIDFLVLEHLEGETVADRLARSASAGSKKKPAFRLDEALAIAMQIADALDKAHQTGLVHRALKPSSVFLVRGGKSSDPPIAKLLDFGLAVAKEDTAPASKKGTISSSQSFLPTKDQATAQSAIVGEVEYLAPEQVEGKAANDRTDLFAFGVVLYEMLTGKKAFEGKSRAVLMAAIMTAEPDPLIAAQPLATPALDHVLKRCLAKDPDDRWQTAHDLLIQLRWITGGDVKTLGADAIKAQRQQWIIRAAIGAAIVMAAAIVTPLAFSLRGSGPQEPFQFRSPVVGLNNADISISPDGRMLAFMARPNQQQPASLFVRPLGGLTSRRLGGTDDATFPFWSPDSRYIGFSAGGKLKKVEAVGGPPQELADAQGFTGGTWSRAGTIVFGTPKGLFSVSAEGGKAVPLTTVEKAETGHFWPLFLPDGDHYIYLAWSAESTNRALYVGSIGAKGRTRLMAAETNVAYASPGFLVFHREATLFAQPFDADTRAFTGDAVRIAGGIAYDPATGHGRFAVSQGDALVYLQGDVGGAGQTGRGQTAANMQLAWVNRSGQIQAGAGDAAQQGDYDVSPDGKLIAVTRQDGNTADIWIIDWQRGGNATRLTLDPADDLNPVWASDGTRVAFTTYRKGNADIYIKNANGVGSEVPLLQSPATEIVEAWSHDGRYLAYLTGQDNFLDIYVLPQFGDKKPFPIVQGHYQKNEAQFSYDGKWLAYTSDESGTFEVYIVAFPSGDNRLKISRDGGGEPRWRADGKELLYRALDHQVMTVDLTTTGSKIEASIPRVLFPGNFNSPMTRDATRHQLGVSADGQQFLVRVAPQAIQNSREGGVTPQAPTVFDPASGQAAGRGNLFFNGIGGGAAGAGRGFAGGVAGLTVIRNWDAIARSRKP
jgi:eukaryotic-like serine/threonine-protein kinase